MSRTYRRKGETQDYYWLLRDWIKTDMYICKEYARCSWRTNEEVYRGTYKSYLYIDTKIDPKSKEGKRRIKAFHSDAQATMDTAPSWFKLVYARRPFRRKEKVALIKAVKYIEEDAIFPVRRKSVLWDYW